MLFTISEEEGVEMYLGNTPIEVDLSTAIYMLQQKDNMPEGMAWGNYFPAVINHTSSAIARKHPDFHAAKHGDYDCYIARCYPNAHIAYNHKMQGCKVNMIPAAYAAKFSAIGMDVEHNIIAVTDVSHTNASDISRISKRVRFEGEVKKGVDYILLDDFITSGAELRDMRDYIQSKGGNVVMMTTFGHGSFGKLKDIRIDNSLIERLKASGITDQDLRKYGIASEIRCLTIGEAAKLSRMVNAKAKTTVAQLCARVQRTHQECPNLPAMETEVPRNGVQGVKTKEITEESKTIKFKL